MIPKSIQDSILDDIHWNGKSVQRLVLPLGRKLDGKLSEAFKDAENFSTEHEAKVTVSSPAVYSKHIEFRFTFERLK